MHKLVSNGHLAEGPDNLKEIKYFDYLFFCHNQSSTKPNIGAKFKGNRWLELYGSAGFSYGLTLDNWHF